ncbi:hypothetical protein [Streptomyces sp. NPDC051662]|uniref:hypothetical protein n=1 Tax=Streptomyces sp. NPDC051662 TaxID=3154750 RepID=UPI00342E7E32
MNRRELVLGQHVAGLDDAVDPERQQQHRVWITEHGVEVVQTDEGEAGVKTVPVGEGVIHATRARHEDDEGEQRHRQRGEPPRRRGMRGQTYTISVMLPDIRNPFFPEILDGLTDAPDATDYQMLMGPGTNSEAAEARVTEP